MAYVCESRMEIKVGQIDGLGAFDEDWRLRMGFYFLLYLEHM